MKKESSDKESVSSNYIVAIGASAGGLEALTTFFTHMPSDSNLSFVIIQHLSPDHKSLMDTLLARHTEMKICVAEDGTVVKANSIYLIPPKNFLTIFNGKLLLNPFNKERGIHLPIDAFFTSLAEDLGPRSIGIILSGTGSDGSIGIKSIKKAGGMVMVQSFETAQFDGMPRSAIATGMIDYICPPEKMPDMITNYIKHPFISNNGENQYSLSLEDTDFNKILAMLRNRTEVDFTYYKSSTILRRMERRMGIAQANSIGEYLDYIFHNSNEIDMLYRDLLVGVTRFFRDTDEFNFFNETIIPKIFENTKKEKNIRVWVAGTSTGEEAYTITILLNRYKEKMGLHHKISIFATDIDQHALDSAAYGVYPEGIANDLSSEILEEFFQKLNNEYKVKTFIREQIIFARHNIFKDPPFTKLDLITCRNLLIYLQNNLQQNIMEIFHFALKDKGFLFLGTSETVGTLSHNFIPMDNRIKIFRHEGQGAPPIKSRLMNKNFSKHIRMGTAGNELNMPLQQKEQIESYYQSIINEICYLVVIVDNAGLIIETFGHPGKFLKFPLGKANLDIKKMVSTKIGTILSTGIRQVLSEKKRIRYRDLKDNTSNDHFYMDIKLAPINILPSNEQYVLIMFEESEKKNAFHVNDMDVESNTEQHIVDLEKEIQYTRESLQATIEELHSSNEELQSTNEELLSSNEELQSTNEELNSVNEELNTVNAEYQEKVTELYETNNDLNNLIRSIDIGTIFLDKHLCIRKYSNAITKEINLLLQDIGRPVSDFSSPILKHLYKDSKLVINNGENIERTVKGEKGKWYQINTQPYMDDRKTIQGVIMTMVDITREKNAALKIETQNNHLKKLIDINPKPTIITDSKGIIQNINQAAEKTLNIEAEAIINKSMDNICIKMADINDQQILFENHPVNLICKTNQPLEKYIIKMTLSNNKTLFLNLFGNPFFNTDNDIDGIVFVFETIAH